MITLGDLLTVFQGAVPIEGCIIVAMTNKYEELKELCPAMFRAGRLTPVLFEHFDMKMLRDVVQKHFGRIIRYNENKRLSVPPSEIMELIIPVKIQNQPYEFFIEKLKKIVPEVIE